MRDPDSQPVQQRIALVVALVALVACFALLVDYTGRSTALALNRPALAARARDLVVLLLFIVSAGTLGAGLTRRGTLLNARKARRQRRQGQGAIWLLSIA